MRVYLAAPYTEGDPEKNVEIAIDAATYLRRRGHAPFVPHLNHYWAKRDKTSNYEIWMEYDRQWIPVCEALIRLKGKSKGADREVAEARRIGIPVYYSVEEFLAASGHAGYEGNVLSKSVERRLVAQRA